MNFQEEVKRLNELSSQVNSVKRTFQESLRPLIKAFMENHPELESFTWRQYTPYFNDGDPCIFRTIPPGEYDEESDIILTDKNDYYVSYLYDNAVAQDRAMYKKYKSLKDDLSDLWSIINQYDDILEKEFGEHSEVKVTHTSIDVTYYDHD